MKYLSILLAAAIALSPQASYAVQWLKQSTAATVKLGPFVDSSDGVTAETGLTISQADVRLAKNGGDYAQKNESSSATHDELGEYNVALDTTDTNTLGRLRVMVQESGAAPVWQDFMVVPANVYDSIVSGSDYLAADTREVGGTTQTANDNGADINAILTDTSTALPGATAGASGGLLIAGTNAATTFGSGLTISNSSGTALTVSSSGGNGHGMLIAGNGTGEGITLTGGATGNGFQIAGGVTSGDGMIITATAGDAVQLLGSANTLYDGAVDLGASITSILGDTGTDGVALANDSITAAVIAADAIGSSEIAANAIGASELADDSIDAGAVADNSLDDAAFASDVSLGSTAPTVAEIWDPARANYTGSLFTIEDILGYKPSPLSSDYEVAVRSVGRRWLDECPIARTTTYYFDSEADDDSGDGLTPETAKKTISAMNTVLAASGTVNVKLKAGSRWRTTTEVDANNNSVSAYGTGPAPILSGFTQTIASGGSAWTNATGDRWTTTDITDCGWIRDQNSDWGTVYREVTSTGEVESTAYSWFASGGTLHINAGSGIDPNDIDWEATPASGSSYSGIILSGHGGRVDGIVCVGQDCIGTTNQSYGIKAEQGGNQVACITNCQTYYHPNHNIGHNVTGTAGGRTLVANCTYGWCKSDAYTGIDYNSDGDQESIWLDCKPLYGSLPQDATRNYCVGRGVYAHTSGGANYVGSIHVINMDLGTSALGVDDIARIANRGDYSADPSDAKLVVYRCTAPEANGRKVVMGHSNVAHVACEIFSKPESSFTDEQFATLSDTRGFVASCKYTLDITQPTMTQFGMHNPSSNDSMVPVFVNNHVHVITDSVDVWFWNRDLYLAGAGSDTHQVYCFNNLFTATVTGGEANPGFGNSPTTTLEANRNAFFGYEANSERGAYDNWQNNLELDYLPSTFPDGPLAYAGDTTYSLLPQVNLYGEKLDTAGESIGPYGRTVPASLAMGTIPTPAAIRTEVDSNSTQLALIVEDTGTTLPATLSSIDTGSVRSTTVDTVTSQTQLVLTAGPDFDDALNNQVIVLTDATNNDYESVRVITDYVGSTKTATLNAAADFTVAAADGVKVYATSPRLDAAVSAVESTTQPRINYAPTVKLKLASRNDGVYVCNKPVRLLPGTFDVEKTIGIDCTPVFGSKVQVATIGDCTVSGGSITATGLGPRDEYAMIQLDGTATASETQTVDVELTMDNGDKVIARFEIEVAGS